MNNFERYEYESAVDGFNDWALIKKPAPKQKNWLVFIHGHGSKGDQLITRQDIKEKLLPSFLQSGFGILCPNLRGNAWMCPEAVHDLHQLISHVRKSYSAEKFIFYSGSMGGTSNLIYTVFHPEDVNVLVALGAVSELPSYIKWCRENAAETKVLSEIADAICSFYKNDSALYKAHSPLYNIEKYTMPIFLAHGELDKLMPVTQMRLFAEKLKGKKDLVFHEIPVGNHDSPLWLGEAFEWTCRMI